MRKLLVCAGIALAAAPAFADTLAEVTTKGIVLNAGGLEIDVSYTPDGKFTAMEGQVTSTWPMTIHVTTSPQTVLISTTPSTIW